MSNDIDAKYMALAIKLAKKASGMTSPNPVVGSVIVKNGEIIGKGYHKKAGLPHAEIEAINNARKQGKKIAGSTLYVTLEPCCHKNKKTPPCLDAVLEEKFSRVVIGSLDRNPQVSGKSVKALKRKGVEVSVGVLEDQCLKINEAFFKHISKKIPFVTLKLASTLDGKIATFSGDSKWIGSEGQRKQGHILRSLSDAVLVGINTVKTDDPMLNVRLEKKRVDKQPIAVVLDTNLEIPLSAKLLTERSGTMIFCSKNINKVKKMKRLKDLGFVVVKTGLDKNGFVNTKEVLKKLGSRGIMSVLVEGGSKVASSFIRYGLVDKAIFFYAPKIVGADGKSMIGELGINEIKDSFELSNVNISSIGNHVMVEGYLN
ncbi:MAG TPA: bifunctional diaminohydroxyphosphoribosylaminopyrimidine deaminase/5-amino-6-(5-phosphoribosylamino)uracil reductase RibD [Thermodesulfobacteriota bacterium]|nr:bifunctional diaminohydroxyphosphoribosylaminopyrimidine deaminase/5-amino-6-(5-phosphoribosylamino)uracil reductase RibD [Thermodesulfobacteriota bacterium]